MVALAPLAAPISVPSTRRMWLSCSASWTRHMQREWMGSGRALRCLGYGSSGAKHSILQLPVPASCVWSWLQIQSSRVHSIVKPTSLDSWCALCCSLEEREQQLNELQAQRTALADQVEVLQVRGAMGGGAVAAGADVGASGAAVAAASAVGTATLLANLKLDGSDGEQLKALETRWVACPAGQPHGAGEVEVCCLPLTSLGRRACCGEAQVSPHFSVTQS